MITLKPVTEPVEIRCPHCEAPLLSVTEHGSKLLVGKYFLTDGDTLWVEPKLFAEQKEGISFDCGLEGSKAALRRTAGRPLAGC